MAKHCPDPPFNPHKLLSEEDQSKEVSDDYPTNTDMSS